MRQWLQLLLALSLAAAWVATYVLLLDEYALLLNGKEPMHITLAKIKLSCFETPPCMDCGKTIIVRAVDSDAGARETWEMGWGFAKADHVFRCPDCHTKAKVEH